MKFEIGVTKENEKKTFTTGFVASGAEASYTVPSDQALASGTWKAKAIDTDNLASEWSATRSSTVIVPPQIRAGLCLIAYPLEASIDAKQALAFDANRWAWYDPTVADPTQRYVRYPDPRTNLQQGGGAKT